MALNPLAGKPAPRDLLTNMPRLISTYYTYHPDADDPNQRLGSPVYERVDAPTTLAEKTALANLSPDMVTATTLAGEPITARLTRAPGNGAPIGGLQVVTANGWFAARPSGTENIYKVYAESFKGGRHLQQIQEEALSIVGAACREAGL